MSGLYSIGQSLDQRVTHRGRVDLPRLPDMHGKETAGKAEGVRQVRRGGLRMRNQELRQHQQAVAIGLGRFATDGAAGLGRHVREVGGLTGYGASREVEAKAELVEQGELEAREFGGQR